MHILTDFVSHEPLKYGGDDEQTSWQRTMGETSKLHGETVPLGRVRKSRVGVAGATGVDRLIRETSETQVLEGPNCRGVPPWAPSCKDYVYNRNQGAKAGTPLQLV